MATPPNPWEQALNRAFPKPGTPTVAFGNRYQKPSPPYNPQKAASQRLEQMAKAATPTGTNAMLQSLQQGIQRTGTIGAGLQGVAGRVNNLTSRATKGVRNVAAAGTAPSAIAGAANGSRGLRTNNPGVGGSRSGGAITSSAPVAPKPAANPLDAIYAEFLASVNGDKNASLKAYQDALANVGGYYDAAKKDMRQSYDNVTQPIQQQAQALGVDNLNEGIKARELDQTLRALQELDDNSKANNQSSLETLKALNSDYFTNVALGLQQQLADAKNPALVAALRGGGSSGGGGGRSGGRRRRGGRGGSGGGSSGGGPYTAKASELNTVNNAGDLAAYDSLGGNPILQDAWNHYYFGAGGNVSKAISQTQKDIETQAAKARSAKFYDLAGKIGAMGRQKGISEVQKAFLSFAGFMGAPSTKRTTSNTSSKKIK